MTQLLEASTASRLANQQLKYRKSRGSVSITKQSSSSASSASTVLPQKVSPDGLIDARRTSGAEVTLKFEDGHTGTVDLADLGIDTTALRLETVHASSWGSAIEVKDVRGKTVHIDSAVLRAYSDPKYARQLEQDIADVEANRSDSQVS
jgi:hypothetical protein